MGTSAQGLAFKLRVAPDGRSLTLDVRWRCAQPAAYVKMLRVRGVPVAEGGEFAWEGANARAADADRRPDTARAARRDPGDRRIFGFDVTGIAAGAGAAWLAQGERVLRADPRSGRIVRAIRLTRARSQRFTRSCGRGGQTLAGMAQDGLIAVGAGAVWVMSNCGPRASRFGWLLRIDPRSDRITRAVALRAAYAALVAGRAGVWALTQGEPALRPASQTMALHRISLRDGRPSSVTPLPGGGATSLALGRGAVWVTQAGERRVGEPAGMLRRFDPARRRLTTVLGFERPASVAVGNGAVWVFDSFARTLTRVRR